MKQEYIGVAIMLFLISLLVYVLIFVDPPEDPSMVCFENIAKKYCSEINMTYKNLDEISFKFFICQEKYYDERIELRPKSKQFYFILSEKNKCFGLRNNGGLKKEWWKKIIS